MAGTRPMKNLLINTIKKSAPPILGLATLLLAYSDFLKHERMEADERQRFVDEVNARDQQLNEELEPLIERNRRLNQQSVSSD